MFDRAYIDYQWLYNLDRSSVYFVSRAKPNMAYQNAETYDIPEKDEDFVLEDVDIEVTGHYYSRDYPKTIRSVCIWDKENDKELVFLTN